MKTYAYIGLVLALMAFTYWYSGNQYDAGYAAAESKYKQEKIEALERESAAIIEIQTANNELSAKLAAAQTAINKRESKIKDLEKSYETEKQRSNECNLSLGSVVLHNASLGHARDTRELNDSSRALSTITGSAFIEHCNGLASEFERQREQLNTFIEAVKN